MTAVLPDANEPASYFDEDLWAYEEATWGREAEPEIFVEPTPAGPDVESSPAPAVVGDFWTRRRVLTHIRDFARARRVAPWAVLGGVLARVVCCCDPNVQLPPTIGSYASINLFIGLVGPSGAGKDASNKVAKDCIDLGTAADFPTVPLGSGEGLSHMFMKYGDNGLEQHNTAALVTVGEIDTLTALVKRQASTVGSQLRQAAMGEQLGFFYVDTAKRMLVPEHRYRLCLVAGVQPKRAGALFSEADGGTPQRFTWMPATDPDAPDKAPPCPPPMVWEAPKWHEAGSEWVGDQCRNVVQVCDTAIDTIVQAHLDRTRGKGDALDGHALLTRLKVATALAILEGRTGVNDEDWDLSGEVMAVSDATRDDMKRVLDAETRRENKVQAEAEATRTILVDDRRFEAAIKRVSSNLTRHLAETGGPVTHGNLRHKLPKRDREHFETAVQALLRSGKIDENVASDGKQRVVRYQLIAGV